VEETLVEGASVARIARAHGVNANQHKEDGHIEIDNNAAERSLRGVALGRKKYLFAGSDASGVAIAQMPQELVGKWVIQREVPTRTISYWSEEDARGIIGSEIEYTPDSFRWKNNVVKHPAVEVRVVTADQFERENSSPSVNGARVSFRQLGINAPQDKQVSINHPPAEITKATTEIPGNEVLLKNQNTIVFSACNLYFEAKRLRR